MTNRNLPLLALLSLMASTAIAAPALPDYEAIETSAGSVTLPSAGDGSLVVFPCKSCAPRAFRAIATTQYLLREQAVTLANLKVAMAGRPTASVTVIYDRKTSELYSISAELDPPSPTPRANADRNRKPAR